MKKAMLGGLLGGMLVLLNGSSGAQGPRGQIDEVVALDNESVRVVLLTYHPGADSDIHLNLGPEITIVQEGELALYTPGGRQGLGTGSAHWLPAMNAHLARNEGARPVKFWSLLLKRCD